MSRSLIAPVNYPAVVPSTLPSPLVMHLATRDVDLRHELGQIACHDDHPMRRAFDDAVCAVPEEISEEIFTRPDVATWLDAMGAAPDSALARVEALLRVIGAEIYRLRRDALISNRQPHPPYGHPALAGVQPTPEGLVRLSDFHPDRGALERNGYVFRVAPPLPDPLSQHWSTQLLLQLPPEETFVRLDPLIVVPVDQHCERVAKMWVYGRDLDWDRIATLRGEEAARWMPDDLTLSNCAFTDVIWSRRDDGVHFESEEVPRNADERPARYFHAIFDSDRRLFVHSDSAVRFYSDAALDERTAEHLKDVDKVGVRVKLFRTDVALAPAEWSTLVASAFVWNNDVQRYLRGERDFDTAIAPLVRRTRH